MTKIRFFNTLGRRMVEFTPIHEGQVGMYTCGPTVYNYIHVGNARPIIMFDVLRRYLEYRGYAVTFVQNFTDVDDKIINRANEEGISSAQVAEKYIEEYFRDAKALGVRPDGGRFGPARPGGDPITPWRRPSSCRRRRRSAGARRTGPRPPFPPSAGP